jgi:hypothetical protein
MRQHKALHTSWMVRWPARRVSMSWNIFLTCTAERAQALRSRGLVLVCYVQMQPNINTNGIHPLGYSEIDLCLCTHVSLLAVEEANEIHKLDLAVRVPVA